MDPISSTAAAGLRARLESLDLLANNLSNASTSGYKADRESYGLYLSPDSLAAEAGGAGRSQSVSPVIEKPWTDFRQGTLHRTGDNAEAALEGTGFFLVQSPQGPLLTRNGTFQVSRDGKLLSREGYEFLRVEPGRPGQLDPALPVQVLNDGTVLQSNALWGRLRIVQAPDTGLAKRDGVFFHLDSRDLPGLRESSAAVRQGYVEQSNVSPAESATRLIEILRQFEGLQRAIQMGGEMNRRSIEELARVAP